jgi:hypothetical protein
LIKRESSAAWARFALSRLVFLLHHCADSNRLDSPAVAFLTYLTRTALDMARSLEIGSLASRSGRPILIRGVSAIFGQALRLGHELIQIWPKMLPDGLELLIAKKLVLAHADVHDLRVVV